MCNLAESEFLVCVGAAGVGTHSDYRDPDLQLQTFSYSRESKSHLTVKGPHICHKFKDKPDKKQQSSKTKKSCDQNTQVLHQLLSFFSFCGNKKRLTLNFSTIFVGGSEAQHPPRNQVKRRKL